MMEGLVKKCKARMEMLGFKGKTRDRAALEFFCGAGMALEAAGVTGVEVNRVTFAAFMVSVRGYSYLEEIEKKKGAA